MRDLNELRISDIIKRMEKKTKKLIIWAVVAILAVLGIYMLIDYSNQPGELDEFARCLEEKGAIFYGAFWCPHCQTQKAMFGRSAKLLPYVECSTPDGRGQLQVCTDEGVEGYPTWEFADGSRLSGEISLQRLAEETSCTLPTN